MKTEFTSALLAAALILVVGCVSPRKGPAYGHEQEFRQQLAESIPVKKYGYSIKQLKFSDDYKKALVIFTHPDTKARPELEFVLASDEFGRYRGLTIQPFYTPGTSETPPIRITVTLPPR